MRIYKLALLLSIGLGSTVPVAWCGEPVVAESKYSVDAEIDEDLKGDYKRQAQILLALEEKYPQKGLYSLLWRSNDTPMVVVFSVEEDQISVREGTVGTAYKGDARGRLANAVDSNAAFAETPKSSQKSGTVVLVVIGLVIVAAIVFFMTRRS